MASQSIARRVHRALGWPVVSLGLLLSAYGWYFTSDRYNALYGALLLFYGLAVLVGGWERNREQKFGPARKRVYRWVGFLGSLCFLSVLLIPHYRYRLRDEILFWGLLACFAALSATLCWPIKKHDLESGSSAAPVGR
jgi:hypothetical protein